MQPRRPTQVSFLCASLCALLVVLVLLPGGLSLAQSRETEGGSADEPPGYRESVDDAVKEFAIQNYVEARSLFHRAHALYPNARTLRGLGMAEFELRHYVECIEHLEAALASEIKPLTGELRDDTQRLLSRANNFVARIQLQTKPAGAHVLLDGTPLASQAAALVLLPIGDHKLEVEAPGFVAQQRKLTVQGGEHKTLTIVLLASSSTPVAAPKKERSWYKSAWLWVGVGVVVAGAAAGAGYALTREDEIARAYGGSAAAVLKGP